MAITKVINDAVDLNQTSDYSGLRLPVGTTADVTDTFTTDYLIVAGGGGTSGDSPGGGGGGGLRTSFNNSPTTTNNLSFPSGKTAIATYMLNGDATDVSGNYNGTEVNPTYNAGLYGGAAIFNGSNAYIDLPLSTSSLFDGKNTLAISFWFKTTTTARQRMFTDYAQTSRNSDIVIDSGNIEVVTDYNQSTNLVYTSSSTYNDGNWHNLIVSLDQSAGQRTIYIDGSLVNTGTLSTNSWSGSGQKVTLGAFYSSSSGYSQYFDGSIDQLRIYNSALDSTNASNIYNNEAQTDSGGGSAAESSLILQAGTAYDVTVGAGGASNTIGSSSIFSTITSTGGGRGGGNGGGGYNGGNGGSGGGGAGGIYSSAGGNGTTAQGYAGGSSGANTGGTSYPGGGGGGAFSVGASPSGSGDPGGNGGAGLAVNILNATNAASASVGEVSSSNVYYSGGGGGSTYQGAPGNGGLGGAGDGDRSDDGTSANNGTINTGGGGGGTNATGGSGVVILRYPTASVSSFTTTGTLNTPSTTDTLANNNYPTTNTAYYKLDGNATDSSGNGYNGTASNVTWSNGRFGQALKYSGAGSNVETTLANSNFTSNYSISFWVNLDNANTFQNFTGNYKSSGGYGGFTFMSRDVSGTYRYGFIWWTGSGGNYNYVDNLDVVATSGVWAHLVATKASGALPKLYVNGTASSLNYLNSDIDHGTTSENFTIGNTLNTNYSAGLIDQVRIFSSELSSSQVTQLYNEHYQTQFTEGSDTAIVFTEGTGTVTFSGTDPIPPQGAVRTNTSFSEGGSASVIEHYNGTEWKQFDAIKYCTTNTLNFPAGAGCIASYNFNDNVNDIGNTYNATNNGVTFTNSGKFGAAGIFNSDAIVIPNNILSSSCSISAWFYLNSTSGYQTLFEFDYENRILFRVASADSNWAYIGNSGYFNPGITYNTGQWYHAVITFNAGNPFKIYINGSLSYTGGNTNVAAFNNDNIVGAANSSGANGVDGKIDQMRIFNDEITASEVLELYNNEVACS